MSKNEEGSSVDRVQPKVHVTSTKRRPIRVYVDPDDEVNQSPLRCCCRKSRNVPMRKSVTTQQLIQLLEEGTKKKDKLGNETENVLFKYKDKKDGCTETGYLRTPSRNSERTMAEMRKKYKCTKYLPDPLETILISNSGVGLSIKKDNKKKKNEEDDPQASAINHMLKNRLNGSISLNRDEAAELGEANVRYKEIEKDYTSMVVSHLVMESDTRRMSVGRGSLTGDVYRSSFTRHSIDIDVGKKEDTSQNEKRMKFEMSSDKEFIDTLPVVSTLAKNELLKNWRETKKYVSTLERYSKSHDYDPKVKSSLDRWMVILYTTSADTDELTQFCCLLLRLILEHHCVAYDERDTGLDWMPYKAELRARQNKLNIEVPYIYAKELAIGGCNVVYAIHRLKRMKVIFGEYMMSQQEYAEWRFQKNNKRNSLVMEVKISSFPALRSILASKGSDVRLGSSEKKYFNQAKGIVDKARMDWITHTSTTFRQPKLLFFVRLRNTIIQVFLTLNEMMKGKPWRETLDCEQGGALHAMRNGDQEALLDVVRDRSECRHRRGTHYFSCPGINMRSPHS